MSEKLTMTVDIRAQLNQFNSAMNTAKEVLNKTFSGKGIKTYTDEMNKIGRIFDKISRTTAGPIDSKATFMQMQKEVMDATQRIEGLRDSISNLRNLTLTQRLSFLPDNFSQNLTKGKNAIEGYYDTIKKINGTKVSDENYQKITKSLEEAEKKLEKINKLQETLAINQRAAAEATTKTEAANKEIEEARILKEQITSLKQKNELRAKYNDLVKNSGLDEETIKTLRNARSSNTVQATLSKVFSQEDVALINKAHDDESKTEGQKRASKRADEKRAKRDASLATEGAKAQANIPAGLSKEKLDEIVKAFGDYDDALQRFKRSGGIESELKKETTTVDELDGKIKDLTTEVKNYDTTLNQSNTAIANNLSALARTGTTAEALENQIADLTQKKEELDTKFDAENELKLQEAYKKLSETLKAYGIDISECGDITQMSAKEFKALFSNLYDNEVVMQEIDRITPELAGQIDNLGDRAEEAATQIYKESDAFDKLSERSENIDRLTARVKQFTGFVGVINLARKAMRDALQTVKDLDKAMTDMAVVTKSTVSDYWEQLPEYTKRANKLGATIRDMYEADTLYYQQGLKTNQVMQVSNETMKMARIAGLGAAEATDRMTNALRGFNMAINEESAQKINDVYSKLAAITASNVDEISTAMTKTASIAHSAGMEFETTAAFLSQIIETTRESAETAGTALKTVIARFEELKKAPSEIGEIDGEIIDANKIEGALRTVGVALRDSEGQFRKLDDVFMELAGKWSSLDKNTQRYIATIAAGSRQQSRFIALMQDYSHTVELVDAAYTSAGTSQEQYEKTLESMETILKRLQNSWNTFTMGLFNSNTIKLLAKGGTELLNLLNKILDTLDITNLGLGKIVLTAVGVNKLGVAFKIFTKQLKADGGTIANSFAAVGTSITNNFTKGIKQANLVTTQIDELRIATITFNEEKAKEIALDQAEVEAREELRIATERAAAAEQRFQAAVTAGKTGRRLGGYEGQVTATQNYLKEQQRSYELAHSKREEARANEQLTISEDRATKARMRLVASANLEEASQKRLNGMLELENGLLLTNENYTYLCAIATNEQATAEVYEMARKGELITVEKLQNIVESHNIEIKYKSILANKLKAASESKLIKIVSLGTSTSLLHAAALAAENKQYVKMIGYLTATAAIITVVIGAIVLIVKLIQKILNMSLNKRINAAKENLDSATESLKDCKDALANLEDEQEKYKSLHEELQKNIQGTKEWKQKLVEVNEQVYELIQKYPILAQYARRSASGEMTISDEGWEAASQLQENQIKSSKMTQYTAQRELFELQQEALKNDIRKQIKSITNKSYSDLDFSSPDSVMNKIGVEIEDAPGLYKALNDYKVTLEKNTSALGTMTKSFSDYVKREDKESLTPLQLEGIDTLFKNMGVIGPYTHDLNLGSYYSTKGIANAGEDYRESSTFKRLAKDYDIWDSITGNDVEALKSLARKVFPQMSETDISERVGGTWDLQKHGQFYREIVDEANRQWAEQNAEKLTASDLEVLGVLSDIDSLTYDLAKKIDKKEIGSEEVQSIVEDILIDQQDSIYHIWRDGFDSIIKDFAPQLSSAQVTKDNVDRIEDPFEREMVNALWALSENFDLKELKSIEGLLMREVAGYGSADVDSILRYAKLENGEVLKELLTFDTSSLEDLETARDILTEKWPQLTKEIDSMIDEISKAGGAVSKLDLQALIDKTKALSGELAKLNNYEQGASFTEEQRKVYIDNGIAKEEDFTLGPDGNYVYTKPIEELKNAIIENTEALENREQILDNQFNLAERYRESQKQGNQDIDDFIKENWDAIVSLNLPGITATTNFDVIGNTLQQQIRDTVKNLGDTLSQGNYEAQKKAYVEALAQSKSSTGTAATNLADLFNTDNALSLEAIEKAGILNLHEGEEGYDALIQQLMKLKTAGKSSEEEYKQFLKTLSNKKDITTAQKGIKDLISTSKTFAEKYNEAGNNTELKMAEVLDQAKQFALDGTKITAENYETYAQYFMQFSEGNYEAYQEIANLLLKQQGLTQDQIAQFWEGNLEITSQGLKDIATLAQSFGLGFTEIIGNKSYLKGWKDLSGFASNTGSGGSKDEWEDPYNWLWNINKRINKEIFERERLERAYQKAVEDATKSEQDLYDVSKKELANLERQAILERDKGQKAMQEAKMMMQQRPEFGNYVSWDAATGQIQVDYNKIDSENWGSARGEAFEEFVSRLEELNDEVQDSQTTLEEIENLTEDIKNRGRDQYIELQDRIKSALVEINQREIDTAQKINDSIKTAQESLLNKIQEEISETRQIRANQEKEQELEDKRQRLNYLRRDTTGANAVQIRQLEEELRKGEQSYTDSLTDQTIQNIQKANQKAEEQRTEQIEIMNNQLTRWQETGAIWDTVNTSINEGFNNPDSFLNSNVASLIASAENRRALSEIQQADWDKELENQAKLAELFNNGELYQQGEQTLEAVQACQTDLRTTMINTGVLGNVDQNLYDILTKVYPKDYSDKINGIASGVGSIDSKLGDVKKSLAEKTADSATSIASSITNLLKGITDTFKELFPGGSGGTGSSAFAASPKKPVLVRNATGGLNTKTGPAWLDGTFAKPEYVLNADQTKAFFDLVNALTSNESTKGGLGGDNYFDIDINVDELASDYDVTQLASKIKEEILEDANYRNVNLVSFLR